MAQFLRPDSTITSTSISAGDHTSIDEATRSDADFAIGTNGSTATLEVGLSNPAATPASGTCTVRYTWAQGDDNTSPFAPASLGNGWNTTTCQVFQGGTEIASGGAQTNSAAWQQGSFTFSTASVTDWTDLRLVFTLTGNGGSPAGRRTSATSWAEVEVPDGAIPPVVFDNGTFTFTGRATEYPASFVQAVDNMSILATLRDVLFQGLRGPIGFDNGSFSFTPNPVNAILSAFLSFDKGAFLLGLKDVLFRPLRLFSIDRGSFVSSLKDVGFLASLSLLIEKLGLTLGLNDINFVQVGLVLFEIARGSFTFTTRAIEAPAAFVVSIQKGAYTLGTNLIEFARGLVLSIQRGSFVLGLNPIQFLSTTVPIVYAFAISTVKFAYKWQMLRIINLLQAPTKFYVGRPPNDKEDRLGQLTNNRSIKWRL